MTIAAITDLAPSTTFFLPGVAPRLQETEYERLQDCARRSSGAEPTAARIQGVACRLGGKDCAVEVGQDYPLGGGEVVAILDLGNHMPYGVFTTADPDAPAFLIGKRVYSIREFS